jgi:hypothetical protein
VQVDDFPHVGEWFFYFVIDDVSLNLQRFSPSR